jgi:hypothetical protein
MCTADFTEHFDLRVEVFPFPPDRHGASKAEERRSAMPSLKQIVERIPEVLLRGMLVRACAVGPLSKAQQSKLKARLEASIF